jgi:hypothetical protein
MTRLMTMALLCVCDIAYWNMMRTPFPLSSSTITCTTTSDDSARKVSLATLEVYEVNEYDIEFCFHGHRSFWRARFLQIFEQSTPLNMKQVIVSLFFITWPHVAVLLSNHPGIRESLSNTSLWQKLPKLDWTFMGQHVVTLYDICLPKLEKTDTMLNKKALIFNKDSC